MSVLWLLLFTFVVSCTSFKLAHNGLLGRQGLRRPQLHHRAGSFPSASNVVAKSNSLLAAHALQDVVPTKTSSSSVVVSFVREVYNQHGLFALALPAVVAGAAWTYYIRRILKNKPTIYECDKCSNQLRAPAGKSRLVLDRPGFKCPRCHSNADSYFDINGWDLRAARRRARLQVEDAAKNKYLDMKEEKTRAAAEYAAMRATAKAREVENQRGSESSSGELESGEEL